MGAIDSKASKRPAIRIPVLFLLVLVSLALALVLEGTQPMHSHEDGQLGLYNSECPLAELAAVHINGWTSTPVTIACPAPIVLPVGVTAFGWVPRPFLSLAGSRAPPLA
jgi:hypothetical protein